ncbi:hypothetical protein BKA70DRAFT_1225236 [Coprinopsis sp. MPI-PUGE-AT-0042]|nr:hypothetical protein BKA70DRAFT_1225236 [Coprinopsis sp. MPI-PUGE-AT-0042]
MPEAAPPEAPDPAKFWRRIKRLGEFLESMKRWEKGDKDEKSKKELVALSQKTHSMKRALGIRSNELDPLIANWFAHLRAKQDIQTNPNILSNSTLKALTGPFAVLKIEEAAPPETSGAHQNRNGKEVMVVVPAYVHAGTNAKSNGRKPTRGDNESSDDEEAAVQNTSRNDDQEADSDAGAVDFDSHGEEVEDAEDVAEGQHGAGARKRGKEEAEVGGARKRVKEEPEVGGQGVGWDDEVVEIEGPKQKQMVKGKQKPVENDTMEVDGGGRRRAQHDDDEWEEDGEEEKEEVDEGEDQQPTRPGKRRRSKQDEDSGDGEKKVGVQTKKKKARLMTVKEAGGSTLVSEVTPRPSEAAKYSPIDDFALFCTKCKRLKRQCWGRNGGLRACLSCHRGHTGLCLLSAYTKSKGSDDSGSSGDNEPKDWKASSKPPAQGKKRNVSAKAKEPSGTPMALTRPSASVSKEHPLQKNRAGEHGAEAIENTKTVSKERPHLKHQVLEELPPGGYHHEQPTAKKDGAKPLIKQSDTGLVKGGVKDAVVVTQVKKSVPAPTTSKEGSAPHRSASSVVGDTIPSTQIGAVEALQSTWIGGV